MEDLIPVENTVIAMSHLGYIKRMTIDNFKNQHRGGKGIKGMQTIEEDYIENLFMATTHHYLMFFTNLVNPDIVSKKASGKEGIVFPRIKGRQPNKEKKSQIKVTVK